MQRPMRKTLITGDPKGTQLRIQIIMLEHIQATTLHARRGDLKNSFEYGVDYVLSDLGNAPPAVFSRNRFNLWALHDVRHGGARGAGAGLDWFKQLLTARGFDYSHAELLLLTQPSFLGLHFNPVSFWIAVVDGHPRAFVAEVNNTFGHRHCYFCAHQDFRPINKREQITAQKIMHVSPFQAVDGVYHFNFGLTDTDVDIRILFENADQGVLATLQGPRRAATNRSLIKAAFRRPFGAARVVALIYWQALILFFKRAPFRKKPPAPEALVSDSSAFKDT